jgi:hypothetical protein
MNNFISYNHIQEQLKTNQYVGLLLKFGSDRCPPCRALDAGPLDKLENMINEKISNGKKILLVNCNLSHHNFTELIAETYISMPSSIPAFYLLKYNPAKNNLLELKYETLGYDTYNPKKWLDEMCNIIVENLK